MRQHGHELDLAPVRLAQGFDELLKLGFRCPALGDVPVRFEHAVNTIITMHQQELARHGDRVSRFRPLFEFPLPCPMFAQNGGDVGKGQRKLALEQPQGGLPARLVGREAIEQLCALIPGLDVAVQTPHEDGVMRKVQQCSHNSEDFARCCIATKTRPLPAGMCSRNSCSGSSPPAEAPRPTTSAAPAPPVALVCT